MVKRSRRNTSRRYSLTPDEQLKIINESLSELANQLVLELRNISAEAIKSFKDISNNSDELSSTMFDIAKQQKNLIKKYNFAENQLNAFVSSVNKKIKEKTVDIGGKALTSKQLIDLIEKTIEENDFTSKLLNKKEFVREISELFKITEDKYIKLIDEVGYLSNELIKPFDMLTEWIKSIPGGKVISNIFGFNEIRYNIETNIREKLIESVKSAKVGFGTLKEIAKSTFQSIGEAIKTLFAHPFLLAFTLIIGSLYKSYKQWQKTIQAAEFIKNETGLAAAEAKKLAEISANVAKKYTSMGVDIETAAKAASALTNEFQTTNIISKELITNTGLMIGTLGIAPNVAAKTIKVFQTMGIKNAKMQKSIISGIAKASQLAGVSVGAVFNDLAESSKEIYTFFKGSIQNAVNATIQLRRMGSSIKDAASAARNLLDFESSITAELEASVLAGTQLDFSKARLLAFNKDLVGFQEEILRQLERIPDFDNLSIYAQEAFARAAGVELDKLYEMREQKKLIGQMDDRQKALYKDTLNKLKEMDELTAEDLIRKEQQYLVQKQITNILSDIAFKLASILFPLFEDIYKVVEAITDSLQKFLSNSDVKVFYNSLKDIAKILISIVKNLSGLGLISIPIIIVSIFLLKRAFSNLFGFLRDQISKIGTLFKSTKTGGFLDKIFGSKKEIDNAVKDTKEIGGIGKRIKEFFNQIGKIEFKSILNFVLILGTLAGSLYVFSLALKGFNEVEWDSVFKGISIIFAMSLLSKLLKNSTSDMLVGSIGLIAIAGALYLFGLALEPFKSIDWEMLAKAGVAIVGFAAAIFALGTIMMTGVGALLFAAGIAGIIGLAGAVAILGMSFVILEKGKSGIDALIDGIARLGALGADLFIAAAGIGAIGLALAAFGGGSIVAGIGSFIGNFLGGDPIEKMERLAKIGPNLNIAAQAINELGKSLNNIKVPDIKNIDELSDIAESSIKLQTSKQTNVNVEAPDNKDLIKKFDEVIDAIRSMKIEMDGRKVGEVISNAIPQYGRA